MKALLVSLSCWLCITLAATQAHAQSTADIRNQIASYEASLESKKLSLENLLNRLSSYEYKIDDAKERLAKVRLEFEESKRNASIAEADQSAEGVRAAELAKRRLELAHHNVESHEARLNRVAKKSDELQQEADKLGSDIESIEKNMSRLANTLKNKLVSEKAVAEAEQKRLQEALAKAQEEERQARLEAETRKNALAEAKEAPPQQLASLKPVAPAPAKVEAAPRKLTPLEKYARREMRLLQEKTRSAEKGEQRHFLELIMEVDKDQVVELEYLGNHQFYSEVQLRKGKRKLTINMRRFIATVPDEADGDTFVVIYDTENKKDGRFVIFNKNLL